MKNLIKLLIINLSVFGSYSLAQTGFSDSKAVNPSILPYRYITSKYITEGNAIGRRSHIASKLKSVGANVDALFEEDKNLIPLVGTFYEFYTINREKVLLTMKMIPPGFEEDEVDETKILRANSFAELAEYYHEMYDSDYTSVIKYFSTDSVQGAFFLSTVSSPTYVVYDYLISDPAFSKEAFVGTVYFERSTLSDNKESNMREILKSIRYGNASPTNPSEGGSSNPQYVTFTKVSDLEAFKQREQNFMVLFSFSWSGPAKMMEAQISKLPSDFPINDKMKIAILKIENAEEGEVVSSYGLLSGVTTIFYKNGVEFKRVSSVFNLENELRAFLDIL